MKMPNAVLKLKSVLKYAGFVLAAYRTLEFFIDQVSSLTDDDNVQ